MGYGNFGGRVEFPVELDRRKIREPIKCKYSDPSDRWSAKFTYQKRTSSSEDPFAWLRKRGELFRKRLGAFFGEISGSFSIIRVKPPPRTGENFLDAVRHHGVCEPLNFKFESVAVSLSVEFVLFVIATLRYNF